MPRSFASSSGSAGIGGSTGSTDNAILRADGTGGSTVQNTGITIDDNNRVAFVAGTASSPAFNFGTAGTGIRGGAAEVAFSFSTIDRVVWDFSNNVQRLASDGQLAWSNTGGNPSATNDVGLGRSAAGVLKITNSTTGAGALEMQEMTAPSAPATNNVRIYAEDDGSGKTRLMALFASGAAQQISIEP